MSKRPQTLIKEEGYMNEDMKKKAKEILAKQKQEKKDGRKS